MNWHMTKDTVEAVAILMTGVGAMVVAVLMVFRVLGWW